MTISQNYWSNKAKMSQRAREHTDIMEATRIDAINTCVAKSEIFTDSCVCDTTPSKNTDIRVIESDSVSAIYAFASTDPRVSRTCVLNFASHKNPGGRFLDGSTAQEESLCHASILFNVLRRFPKYYERNCANLNRALYTNRAIYTPAVPFGEYYADVLTCAAPNKSAALRYRRASNDENYAALTSRIDFVLAIAAKFQPNTLILGAYGCGVFGQDPAEVASIFKTLLDTKYRNVFANIIFAIPDKNGANYQAFAKTFQRGMRGE